MKSLFVSICGAPNAGKSTLVNLLVGEKVSIVSPKVQTTREVVRGIVTENDTQIIFLDTPGIFKPRRDLEKSIVKNAHAGIRDGQMICLVIDAKQKSIDSNTSFIIHELKAKKRQCIVALNKIDTLTENEIIQTLEKIFDPEIMMQVFPISAKTGRGIDRLKEYLVANAQDDTWYYDKDDVTDRDLYFLSSELTREKLFINLKKELPYNIYVTTDEIVDEGDFYNVLQTVYVSKDSQKNIVIGKNGSMIAKIAKEGVVEMNAIFGKNVKLSVFVKVKEDWMSRM